MSAGPSHQQHQQAAAAGPPPRCAVLTISDTRTIETDTSGALCCRLLEAAGYIIAVRDLLPDEPERIAPRLEALCADEGVDAVLLCGGTGIARRDRTYDVVAARLDKVIPGFGELFRWLSFQEVGAAAMLSRAVAGVRAGTLVFAMPGSENAVEVALTQLIVPELAHLVWELRR